MRGEECEEAEVMLQMNTLSGHPVVVRSVRSVRRKMMLQMNTLSGHSV